MEHYCGARYKMLSVTTVAVLSIGILLPGCHSSPHNSVIYEAKNVPVQNKSEEGATYTHFVTLAPGDVVEVKFFYTPDLNEVQTVRPDGKITLQLIGEIEVEKKSPTELRAELIKLYTPLLKTPEIAVIVRSFYERRVYVGGQVMAPGIIEMPGTMTLLEAIMQAGGFNVKEAEVRNVIIIRHINGQRFGQSINLKPALTGDKVQPFFLAPKDIIYVPQTTIAKIDQWVDQHINKIIPDTGFNFRRTMGNTTIGMGSYR